MTHLHNLLCRGPLILTVAFLSAVEPPVFAGERAGKSPASIELTLVDDQAIGYATFQSHNQKVVSNRHGIFITYIRKSNKNYTAQQWRLARSTDGGRSFATVMEETRATSAPALETDKQGRLFFARPDFKDGNAYLSRLDSLSDKPSMATLDGGSAGKYCLALDEPRKQLYYFAHNGTFHIVGVDGQIRRKTNLLAHGDHAVLQYPHLTLSRDGTLYAAWTTSKRTGYLYPSIHAMKSADGGESWMTLEGKPLKPPIVADVTGPATQISRDDELEVHSWLSAFMAKDGKLHFVYWAKTTPQRQRYLRYDGATGKKEVDIEPLFQKRTFAEPNDSGVLVANRSARDSTMYFVSTIEDRKRLACLASGDNGNTWREYAISNFAFKHRVYSIGAAREITDDGWIVGTFTDVVEGAKSFYEPNSGDVYFFRIKARTTDLSDQEYRIETIAGNGKLGDTPEKGSHARDVPVDYPFGVENGPDGALYVTTVASHRVLRLDPETKKITSVAGNGRQGYSGDGGPATEAMMNEPYEVRFDSQGNMLIVEMRNHLIRRVDAKTGIISTLAGDGVAGDRGDGGPARKARFRHPHNIVLDKHDNIYISDILNHRVRRIDAKSGRIETLVGNGKSEFPQDGGLAKEQPLLTPAGIVVHGDNLWVTSYRGHMIWRLDFKTGLIHRIAGTGRKGYSGDGGNPLEATFDGPRGITMSPEGVLYLVEGENNIIRAIDTVRGTIRTIAGAGPKRHLYTGDGVPALEAPLWQPHGVCVSKNGTLVLSDTKNHRVRRLLPVRRIQ
jgi:DNA-binding beta-propeller fold protein YncE